MRIGVVAPVGATPGKRLQAPSGVFNASGSDREDPLQLVPRSGWGQASKKRWRNRGTGSAPAAASNQCVRAARRVDAATVAACSKAH